MTALAAFASLSMLRACIRMATPLALAALGGILTMHAGILNIALEGLMLVGAFSSVAASYYFGSALLGLAFGVGAALAVGLVYGLFVVDLGSDPFVIGIALNIFADGATVYLLRTMFGVKGALASERIRALPTLSWPLLARVPAVDALLNGHSVLTYGAWALVLGVSLMLYRTPLGWRLRAAGEHPAMLETAGVSPRRMRYYASLASAALAGLAGVHLALGYLNQFAENMAAGRGFIAIAATIFGAGKPIPVYGACLLFGAADAVAMRLQGSKIPPHFALMIPYLATVGALWLVSWRASRTPSGPLRLEEGEGIHDDGQAARDPGL